MRAAIIYVLAVLAANLTATAFIPFPVFGQVAVGTLIFGVTFTQRDRMHMIGRRMVYTVIAISALLTLLLLTSVSFYWGEPAALWLHDNGWTWTGDSLAMLAESGPRVFIASILAILIAESTDTEIFHHFRDRSWMGRVLRSNAVSVPLDSLIFNCTAFLGIFSPFLIAQIIFGEIVVKFGVSLVYAFLLPRRARRP